MHGRGVSVAAIRGLPIRIASSRTPVGLERHLASLTQSRLMSAVDAYYPPPTRTHLLVGTVRKDRIRLQLTNLDRLPFWHLAPAFNGRIEPVGDGSALVGTLRVRRSTLIGVAAIPPVMFLVPELPVLVLGTLCLARVVWDIGLALPMTTQALIVRLEDCIVAPDSVGRTAAEDTG
jgi:hypothetical protein